jgi:hypothetical protein
MQNNIDYKPKSFQWNSTNIDWVKSYLTQKSRLLNKITDGVGVDIANINLLQFNALCSLLEKTAEGRELRTKMFKAWRSKKSRDSNNGKKIFTFNLEVKAGAQLKKLAHNNPINKTLEDLIYGTYESVEKIRLQTKELKAQEKREARQQQAIQAEEELLQHYEVQELAKKEKSELVRTILRLNKQVKKQEEDLQEKQKVLNALQKEFGL